MNKPSVRLRVAGVRECFNLISKMLPPRNLAELSAVVSYSARCVRALIPVIEKDEKLSAMLEVVLGAPVRDYFESCVREAESISDPSESLSRKFDCAWNVIVTLLAITPEEEEEGRRRIAK